MTKQPTEFPDTCVHGTGVEIGVSAERRAVYEDGCVWTPKARWGEQPTDTDLAVRSLTRAAQGLCPFCGEALEGRPVEGHCEQLN